MTRQPDGAPCVKPLPILNPWLAIWVLTTIHVGVQLQASCFSSCVVPCETAHSFEQPQQQSSPPPQTASEQQQHVRHKQPLMSFARLGIDKDRPSGAHRRRSSRNSTRHRRPASSACICKTWSPQGLNGPARPHVRDSGQPPGHRLTADESARINTQRCFLAPKIAVLFFL